LFISPSFYSEFYTHYATQCSHHHHYHHHLRADTATVSPTTLLSERSKELPSAPCYPTPESP
ncbi:hypothetical protein AGABI1DRAFT_111013, partial [Agaricus bisporus var. burnettii JB137-S8]